MNRLWAPWRRTYLRSSPDKRTGCLFCGLLKDTKDKKNLVLSRTAHYAVILNRYPYNNGHLMIVPRRHVAHLAQLNALERAEFFDVLTRMQNALCRAMKPHGFNLGMNIEDIAGAGIPDHLHWHIVPRWKGDVNFMPVVAGSKVISESLESAYEVLKKALAEQDAARRKQAVSRKGGKKK